ncbi:MAG: DUF2007 domain-containing protein [Elusimicrobia bacterium]|nr:DUF2007 domain-containing protein [Elusimicrobiota bacterium]
MADEDGPVVVFASTNLLEAEQVRSLLDGCGIMARVLDGNFVSMQPWLSLWAGGIKVVVPAAREADAKAVLRDAGFDGGDPQTWPKLK